MKILLWIIILGLTTNVQADFTKVLDVSGHITCSMFNKERYLGNISLQPTGIHVTGMEALDIFGVVKGSLSTQSMYHNITTTSLLILVQKVDQYCIKYPDILLVNIIWRMVVTEYPQKALTVK